MDTDVALWLDYRAFNGSPALKVIDDFVIVTTDLHDEFDKFKKSENLEFKGLNLVPPIELLQYWNILMDNNLQSISRYGKDYFLLQPSQLDNLIDWIGDLKIKFMSEGQSVFEDKSETEDVADSGNETVGLN